MRVVFDAVGVRAGSVTTTLENLLRGWTEFYGDDRITVLSDVEPTFAVPVGVEIHRLKSPIGGPVGALWSRSVGVRSATRRLGADGLVSLLTASAFAGASCPRGTILYDLRHELRPHQFGRARRLSRRMSYSWSLRTADGIYCISERTRDDFVRSRPKLEGKAILARYGSDHVDHWPAARGKELPYALAFGHFENKNVVPVLDAWAIFCQRNSDLTLRLVGMSGTDRKSAGDRVTRLGIESRVELMPWLDDDEFVSCFRGSRLIVFPSDFEGFGLPAIEALRLSIPLVISSDPALTEVTGGHASAATDVRPETLAAAMVDALAQSPEQLEAGREHTNQFQWRFMARAIRESLAIQSTKVKP